MYLRRNRNVVRVLVIGRWTPLAPAGAGSDPKHTNDTNRSTHQYRSSRINPVCMIGSETRSILHEFRVLCCSKPRWVSSKCRLTMKARSQNCGAFSFGPFIGFWLAFEAAQQLQCLCIPGGSLSSAGRLRAIYENKATVLCCTPSY